VRNAGSGENRFITKGEFDLAMKKLSATPTPVVQDVPGRYFSSSVAPAASGASVAADLLPSANTWTGLNVWERPTPVSTEADNWHIKFSRDGQARWVFALGHNLDVPSTNGANDGTVQNSFGNLYIDDPGRSASDNGGFAAIIYPVSKGSGMRLFGRLSFDESQLYKSMIQFRETQGVGWDSTGSITTAFYSYNGLWTLRNAGRDLFSVSAADGAIFLRGARLSADDVTMGQMGVERRVQDWWDGHVQYTVQFEEFIIGQLDAIKARLTAHGI